MLRGHKYTLCEKRKIEKCVELLVEGKKCLPDTECYRDRTANIKPIYGWLSKYNDNNNLCVPMTNHLSEERL